MEDPHQFVSQSDSGKSFANGSKDQQETMIPKVQHPSFHPSWKNRAVMGQDKTIEKLQKSFQRLETIKEKPSKKVTNLKTMLNYTEPEAREDKERAYQKLEALTNELYTVNREIEAVVKRAKESPFDPPLEADSSPNSMLYFKRGANSVHTDFADLLVKNKTLQTEVCGSFTNRIFRENYSSINMGKNQADYNILTIFCTMLLGVYLLTMVFIRPKSLQREALNFVNSEVVFR
ncbi:uncharacterized protein LOC141504114 [Macrotis lagotis]|uniref:uncharacterized protein LOC141504114 n=1 Tax=Macrotis lagotis TaxID=92651 RepID=UPI003D697DB0